jgi:hypothetical protein
MQVSVTPSDAPLISLPGTPLLRVLVVCGRGEHLQRVRCLASRWPQAAHVHWIPDPEDALQYARVSVPQLAIVDARLERACASSLGMRLRSVSPDLVVMNFDVPSGMHGDAPDSHWHWSELGKATDWWVRRHLGAQALQKPPTVQ